MATSIARPARIAIPPPATASTACTAWRSSPRTSAPVTRASRWSGTGAIATSRVHAPPASHASDDKGPPGVGSHPNRPSPASLARISVLRDAAIRAATWARARAGRRPWSSSISSTPNRTPRIARSSAASRARSTRPYLRCTPPPRAFATVETSTVHASSSIFARWSSASAAVATGIASRTYSIRASLPDGGRGARGHSCMMTRHDLLASGLTSAAAAAGRGARSGGPPRVRALATPEIRRPPESAMSSRSGSSSSVISIDDGVARFAGHPPHASIARSTAHTCAQPGSSDALHAHAASNTRSPRSEGIRRTRRSWLPARTVATAPPSASTSPWTVVAYRSPRLISVAASSPRSAAQRPRLAPRSASGSDRITAVLPDRPDIRANQVSRRRTVRDGGVKQYGARAAIFPATPPWSRKPSPTLSSTASRTSSTRTAPMRARSSASSAG